MRLICRPRLFPTTSRHTTFEMITAFMDFKVVILLFAFAITFANCQTISPCVTECVIQYCPNGVSDNPCFCSQETSTINSCINVTCDAGGVGDYQFLLNEFCNYLVFMVLTGLGGSVTSSSSSAATGSATAASSGTMLRKGS
jgi:hypothetical protein